MNVEMYTPQCMQHEPMQLFVIPDDYTANRTGWACIMMSDGNPPPGTLGNGWNIVLNNWTEQ